MITHLEARAIAEKQMPGLHAVSCIDIGDRFAFSFADKKGRVPPGTPFVCVHKESEEVSEILVPPIENLDILEAGTIVQL